MVILGHFFSNTQIHGQNRLMVTSSHLYSTSRAIYHHPLKCIYKFLLVYGTCLPIGFSNEMGSDVTMESWETGRSSISILKGFDKGFIGRGFRVIEMVIHRPHHTFRGGFKTEWFENGMVCGSMHKNRYLFMNPGGFACFQRIGHCGPSAANDERIRFFRHHGGEIRDEVRLTCFPPRFTHLLHARFLSL